MTAKRLPAHTVTELFVLQKAEYFTDTQVWPSRQALNVRGWLGNFSEDERSMAVHLLNAFVYFNESICDALLRSAVQTLSVDITAAVVSLADAKAKWRDLVSKITVSCVEGENPQPTDSGHLFARKARQALGIADTQILQPAEAIARLAKGVGGTLLLVDDFVGSGDQMRSSWNRVYASSSGYKGTLRGLHETGTRIIYAPLVATHYGIGVLHSDCVGLEVRAAHEIGDQYSLTHRDSILWPTALKEAGPDFVYRVSDRIGIVNEAPHGWEGYHNLALGIAFWHSVPDATLPLFYWDRNGWIPLVRRT